MQFLTKVFCLTVVFNFTLISGCGSKDPLPSDDISERFPFESRYIQVLGSDMHYIDEGEGDVILLLHGNPESIYAWRNVVPHLIPHARVIAVDLIGMGKSAKPDIEYSFQDHAKYLESFIETLDLQDLTIVGHDWGTGLQFHYSTQHQGNVKGLVFFEAVLDVDYWDNHGIEYQEIMKFLRSDAGRVDIEKNNTIVELMKDDILRTMTDIEFATYREPFQSAKERYLTWKWVTEIPIEGEPAAMHELVSRYNGILMNWDIPMLHLYGEPGGEYGPQTAQAFASVLKNGTATSVGSGLHYILEDQPHNIGREIANWFTSEIN